MTKEVIGKPLARSFVQCWKEVSTLAVTQDPTQPEKLIEAGVDHFSSLYEVAEEAGLSFDDPNDHYIIRQLSLALAQHPQGSLSSSDITAAVRAIHENITEDNELLSLVSDSEEINSLVITVRASLLASTLSLYRYSRLAGVSESNQSILFTWLQNTSIKLSQDIAFNWSDISDYHERECLFSGTLRECSEFVVLSWVESLCSGLTSLPTITKSSLWLSLPALEQEILDQGMGYESHPEFDYSWLKSEIAEYVYGALNNQPWRIEKTPARIAAKLDIEFVRQVEDIAIQAWRESCENMLSRIAEMSESEMDAWMNSAEGQRPMSLDAFFRECHCLLETHGPIRPTLAVDLEKAADLARSRLAKAWGISDSVLSLQDERETESEEDNQF